MISPGIAAETRLREARGKLVDPKVIKQVNYEKFYRQGDLWMIRGDLKHNLQNHFNNTVYYTDVDLTDSIQDGLDEVVAFTGCVYKSAVLPFTKNTTYYDMLTLLPDYIGVVAIFNDVMHRWMWPTSLRKLEQQRVDWDTIGGTPYYFTPINHRYVAIWYKPLVENYGNMVIYYRAAAPILTSDGDQIPIPEEHTDALEHYCITDLWEQAQEWGKSSDQIKDYITHINDLRVYIRNKRNPGRLPSLKG
jgi:hypothetical protein